MFFVCLHFNKTLQNNDEEDIMTHLDFKDITHSKSGKAMYDFNLFAVCSLSVDVD